MKQIKTVLFILLSTILLLAFGCEKDEVTPALDQEISGKEVNDAEASQSIDKMKLAETSTDEPDVTEETLENEETDIEKDYESKDEVKSIEKQDSSGEKESTFQNSTNTKSASSSTTSKTTTEEAEKTDATSTPTQTTTEKKTSTQKTDTTSTPAKTITEKKTSTQKTDAKQAEPPKEKTATPPAKTEKPKQTVTVSVVGDSEKGTILSATKVEMSDGNTVLDVTLKILKQRGIPISVTGSGASAYVEGIGNLFEFDRGPLSGWTVKRNGTTLDRSSGTTKVSNGDSVQWIYTTNYKED